MRGAQYTSCLQNSWVATEWWLKGISVTLSWENLSPQFNTMVGNFIFCLTIVMLYLCINFQFFYCKSVLCNISWLPTHKVLNRSTTLYYLLREQDRLTILKVFYHPELFFHVLNEIFLPPCSLNRYYRVCKFVSIHRQMNGRPHVHSKFDLEEKSSVYYCYYWKWRYDEFSSHKSPFLVLNWTFFHQDLILIFLCQASQNPHVRLLY